MPELLRFCGQTLYVGAMLDSYDPLLDDVIKGQWAEPLETNNMAWSQTTQIQYACSSLDTINQKRESRELVHHNGLCPVLIATLIVVNPF